MNLCDPLKTTVFWQDSMKIFGEPWLVKLDWLNHGTGLDIPTFG